MASSVMLNDIEFIRELLGSKKTYNQISQALCLRHGYVRGFSEMSVRLFCKKYGLRSVISSGTLEREVSLSVAEASNFIAILLYLQSLLLTLNCELLSAKTV